VKELSMTEETTGNLAMLEATRRSLHAVAELLLAGPQFEHSQSIELRVTPGGFGTTKSPDLRVDGAELVAGELRFALSGRSVAELGAAVGVEPRSLRDVYAVGPELGPHEPLIVDTASAEAIAQAFAFGDQAMAELDASRHRVLWPEHFDVGIEADKVNYGVSPGDDTCAEPYAYVGPWDLATRTDPDDAFWNASFGASRTIRELVDETGVLAFFEAGREKT
jgi:hypothetical protein